MSTEIKEVKKLTKEQIAQFSIVEENYEFLSGRLTPADMNTFNPMVTELLSLKSFEENLQLAPADEDGKFDKANIQLFTDTKVAVGKYNAGIKLASKEMKAPQILINKAVTAIEKKFLEEAAAVKESAIKKFAPYVAAEEQKKLDKEAARDKALIDAANKAKEELAVQQAKNDLVGLYNTIKYERIAENITSAASNTAAEGNKEAVTNSRAIIASYTIDSLTADLDFDLLSQEHQSELHTAFNTSQKTALALLDTRLTSMATAEANIALEAKVEAVTPKPETPVDRTVTYGGGHGFVPRAPTEQVSKVPNPIPSMDEAVTKIAAALGDIPLPPGVTLPVEIVDENGVTLSNDDFLVWVCEKLQFIERALDDRIKTSKVPDPRIVHIRKNLNQ